MKDVNQTYLNLSKEQFKAFIELETNGPLQMVNLLKFKKVVEGTGISGKDQYDIYMKKAYPFFQKANAKITFLGKAHFSLIGPQDNLEWDKILIVEYSAKADFVNMVTSEGYPAKLRDLAIEDSRLIYCEQT